MKPKPEKPDQEKGDRSERLKTDLSFDELVGRVVRTPAGSVPPREVKPRKKRTPRKAD